MQFNGKYKTVHNTPNKVIFGWYPSSKDSAWSTAYLHHISCFYHKVNIPLDFWGLTAALLALSSCGHHKEDLASAFILHMPGCYSCISFSNLSWNFWGITTRKPHKIQPWSVVSSFFLWKYGWRLSGRAFILWGHPWDVYVTILDKTVSTLVASLMSHALIGNSSRYVVWKTSSTSSSAGLTGSLDIASAFELLLDVRYAMRYIFTDSINTHLCMRAAATG